jgi:hypothetical protein
MLEQVQRVMPENRGKLYCGSCAKKDYQGYVVVSQYHKGVLKGQKTKSLERITTESIMYL